MLFTVVMFLTEKKKHCRKKEKENDLRAHLYGVSSINGGRAVH